MAFTAKQALALSVQHNLGSPRNTLVPGVQVPAFTVGMDPNVWANRVTAIGLSRLQPAGTDTSQFKYGNVPGSFDIGSSAPGSSTIMIPKSDQEKEQAIQTLMSTLPEASGGAGGGSQFSSGQWMFGNDIGGLQSNVLQGTALAEQMRAARAREALASQQLAANQQQTMQDAALRRAQYARQNDQTDLSNKLALLTQLQNAGQMSFDDAMKIAQLTGSNADTAALNEAGMQVIAQKQDAQNQFSTAQEAYNAAVEDLVKNTQGLAITADKNGLFGITTDKGVPLSARNPVYQQLTQTDGYKALQSATDALKNAQASEMRLQFLPKTTKTAPAMPQTMTPQLMQLLGRYGVSIPGGASSTPLTFDATTGRQVPAAVPFVVKDARRSAPASQDLSGLSDLDWLDAMANQPTASPRVGVDARGLHTSFTPGLGNLLAPEGWYDSTAAPAAMPDGFVSGAGDLIGNPDMRLPSGWTTGEDGSPMRISSGTNALDSWLKSMVANSAAGFTGQAATPKLPLWSMPPIAQIAAALTGGLPQQMGFPNAAPATPPPQLINPAMIATNAPAVSNALAQATAALPSVPTATLPIVTTKAQWNAIKSGGMYQGKDGKTYRKP